MTEIIGQILGIILLLGSIINSQFPKRWQMLLGLSVLNLVSAANQLLVGAGLTACLLGAVAVVNCAINSYKSKKDIPIRLWENILFSVIYLCAWLLGFWASSKNGTPLYLDLMTLAATVFFVASVFLPKERDIRLATFGNAFIYFVYNIINLNSSALAMLFNMISIIIALVRYRDKDSGKKKGSNA
jgi:hypothetical protein